MKENAIGFKNFRPTVPTAIMLLREETELFSMIIMK